MTTLNITIWERCDPRLASAITTFFQKWEPYSTQSKRYSIFGLLRECIDPAWAALSSDFQSLNHEALNRIWVQFGKDQGHELRPLDTYSFSALAIRLHFDNLDLLIKMIGHNVADQDDGNSILPSLDTLRELAVACRRKKPKRDSGRKIIPFRDRAICRYCNMPTELAEQAANKKRALHKEKQDPKNQKNVILSTLSALYCSNHRSKEAFSDSVRSEYFKAKRSQRSFDKELERLDWQSWAGTKNAGAKSGNALIDQFIWRLSMLLRLTYEQQDFDQDDILESNLRLEARKLVDKCITDRKKEIVALLASGINQSEVARHLGIKRQAVSKALQSIPNEYRLDILCKPT